jgi:hypothetical protein
MRRCALREGFSPSLADGQLALSAYDFSQGLCNRHILCTYMVCPALTSHYCRNVEAPARGFVAERVVGQDARSLIAAEVAGCPEYATCLRNTGSNDQCFRVDGWRGGEVSDRSYIYLRGLLR